jgi:beta-galactosidase
MLGPESPGYGLCTPAGEPTERTEAARAMALVLDEFPELRTSRPVVPKAGLLLSRQTAFVTFAADRNMDVYSAALRGAYRAFHDQNIALTFVHEDQLGRSGVPEGIDYLYWPMPVMANQQGAAALTEFVRRGGTLVAEAAPGLHREHGWTSATVPGQGMNHLFGAEEIESDHRDRVEIAMADANSIEGDWLVERLRVFGAEVVATFADGTPAIVENRFGAGRAILVATYPSLAYDARRPAGTGWWIAGHDRLTLTAVDVAPQSGLLVRLHTADDGAVILFAINLGPTAVDSSIRLRNATVEKARVSAGIQLVDGELRARLNSQEGAVGVLQTRSSQV